MDWEASLETKVRQSVSHSRPYSPPRHLWQTPFFVIEWHVMSGKKHQGVKIEPCTVPRQRGRVWQQRGLQCHSCSREERTTRQKKKKKSSQGQCCHCPVLSIDGSSMCRRGLHVYLAAWGLEHVCLHAEPLQTQTTMRRRRFVKGYQQSGRANKRFELWLMNIACQ